MSLEKYMSAQIEAMTATMDRETQEDPAAYSQAALDWIVRCAADFRIEWEQNRTAL